MAYFTFLRAGLNKITPPHLTNWLLAVCMFVANLLYAQNNQFYPNRIWVKVLNEQNAPIGTQSIQTPNNVINSVLNNHNIVYFQKAFPWSSDSVVSTFYEIYCNCNIDDLIADINQNLQGLIIHPKKIPLPEFMNYNPEDNLWQLTLIDPSQLWHLLKIQAPQAWNITIGNPNIKIAVIDNFIDATHPDLQSKLLTNADPLTGQAYTVPTNNLSLYDHGTAVSGFAAAQTTPVGQNQPQGADYASIGFNSSLIFYELGHVPPPNIPNPIWGITGLQKAHHASYVMCADVISISWKNNFCGPDLLGYEEAIVRDILKNGTTIVASAGNGIHSYNCPINEQYPYPFSPTYPGCEDIILVTGTDIMDNHNPHNTPQNIFNINVACGSLTPPIIWSHNEEIDICAPSYHLMRLNPGNTFVTKCSGTSMSAPIVAGTAALMKSVNPCLTPHDIDEILNNPANADPINDAYQYPGLLGAGRLNAFKAVQAAQNYIPSHVALIDKNLINRNICKGQSTQLFALSNVCANLQWSNPQTLNNSAISNPIATPQQTTVYTLYASYPNGCIRQDTVVIYVYPLPDKPILSGINNTCDGLTLNYTITNYNTQQSYVWNVSGGTVINQSGANATIQWNSSQGGTISVTTTNLNACQNTSDIFLVHPCCIPSGLPPSTVYWNNTVASAINPADNPIVINGIFSVNQNLTLVNKQIYLGPDAKIDITSGISLTLRNCTLQAGCNYMWDGIYASYGNSAVNISQNSEFKDAQNAIVSRNGGHFLISNSTFDRNYKHIVVENYNQPHIASIVSSQLLCSGGNTLIAPHIGKRTHKAIEIKDVYQIQIGSQLQAANKNTIDNADYGIWAERSQVMVYNNDFKNITNVPPPLGTIPPKREPCPKGTAICSYTDANYYFAELHIGGLAQNEANLFDNCGKGIVSNFSHHINIIKNNFNNISQTAVEVNDAEWRNIKIDRNNFTAATTGVNIWNCVFSPVDVINNNFDLANKTNGTAIILRAIYPSGPVQMHSVRNNCIYNYSNGIVTYNTLATSIADNIIRIRHTNQPAVKNGINASFSVNSKILSNDIRLAGNNNTFTNDPNVNGIYASLSMGSNFICNQVRNTGTAMRCAGQMPSDIVGNSLLGRYTGLWLSNDGFIGVQDHPQIPGWPSYNTWHINVNQYSLGFKTLTSHNTNGFNSPIIYRQQGAMYNPNPGTAINSFQFATISTNLGTAQYACAILAGGCNQGPPNNNIPNNMGKKPKRISEDIINETPVFKGNAAEAHLLNKKALYHYLKNDTSALTTTEQQFISNNDVLVEGKIREWVLLTADTTFTTNVLLQQQAQSVEASIAPQHSMEQYVKQVLEIYRQRLSAGVDTFSQSQLQQLEEIAHLCPFTDGYGVYMARAILFDNGTELIYNACEFDVVSTNRMNNSSNNGSVEQITSGEEIADISVFAVYPNPASEYIQVEYETQDNLIFEIMDAYGKIVISDILVKEQTKQSIDVSNLPTGIYYYTIEKDGIKLVRDKIVIVR